MNKELKNIIKKMSGNVLGIGLNDKLEELIIKNNNIIECNFLSNRGSEKKHSFNFFNKTVKINKIRKKIKKKSVDYILCNFDVICKYLNTFVKDSVYLNNGKLYFYGNLDIDLLKKRYSRYDVKIEVNKEIFIVDNSKSKNNIIKDFYYRIIDAISKFIELIGDLLMN